MKKIEIEVRKKVYRFCSKSEILSANEVFCLIEPNFEESSAVCSLSCKNGKILLPTIIQKNFRSLDDVYKLRIFFDNLERKKLIIHLKT